MNLDPLTIFQQTILYTAADGRARFKEEPIPLNQGKPAAVLSEVFASGGFPPRPRPGGLCPEFPFPCAPPMGFILERPKGDGGARGRQVATRLQPRVRPRQPFF